MKPDWDKLMKNWNKGTRAETSLIADVDCTAEGKPLCETFGVRGYPTIKWGDASALEDFEGGRSYDDLKKFAKESLKPMCSPANIELCDEEKKAEIAKLEEMSTEELAAKIEEGKSAMKAAEELFEKEVKELQETFAAIKKAKSKTKAESIAAIKKGGLGLMQAVHFKKSKPAAKSEL